MANNRELAEKLRELQTLIGDGEKEIKIPIRDLWESWAKGMRAMKSMATIASINSSWKHLEPLIGDRYVDEINGEFWTNVVIPKIREKTHQGIKFANDRKWLSMFLKWCVENGKGPRGWIKPRLVDPDPDTEPGYVYTPEEMRRLEANADLLLLTKIVMANPHFMRRSEIALMSKDRIDRANRVMYLRAQDTKIRKPRIIPYNDRLESLFVALDTYHVSRGIISPWLFPARGNPAKSIGRGGFSTAWESCRRRAGLLEIGTFHDLRRTAITDAINAVGSNIMLICTVAGLDAAMAQKIYYKPNIDDLRRVTK